ncbi:hypothetical protein ACH5RR_009048 [Cinchona calisaya]|uniref:Uncharacterized protein n=1 Tax=Cinchona calisaya TaxID=153742 RepID=A0ABD3AD29_9GENT
MQEKEKLNKYNRDSVTTHYTKLRDSLKEGLEADISWPLSVGQRVIAMHPKQERFTMEPCTAPHVHAKEADVQTLSQLSRADGQFLSGLSCCTLTEFKVHEKQGSG